jgi:hypothetical protein
MYDRQISELEEEEKKDPSLSKAQSSGTSSPMRHLTTLKRK